MSLTPNSRHNLPTFEQLSNGLGGGSLTVLESLRRRATEGRLPCYLVGGPVRDLLLGVPLRDLDVSIERDATALAAVLAEELGAKLTIHRQFGTATLTLSGEHVDFVTARKEVYPRPGALPKVSPGTIIDDLARRDFSVNAIALPLSAARYGVVDPHGGADDLERRIIRTLHSASFVDDPTRMMRAVRYERRLGFSLEDSTLDDLRGALASGAMATVSGDRWRRELDRILDEPRPIDALVRAIELGILAGIHPGLTRSDSIKRIAASPHAGPDRFFAGLVYPLSQVEGEEVIRRLKLPRQRARLVRDTIRLRENESELKNTVSTTSKLVASLDSVDPEAVGAVAILTDAPRVRQGLDRYIAEFRTVSPRLTGEDLLAMGVIQGPEIGELLARLLDARLDRLVETVDDEREMARDWIFRRQVVSQTT